MCNNVNFLETVKMHELRMRVVYKLIKRKPRETKISVSLCTFDSKEETIIDITLKENLIALKSAEYLNGEGNFEHLFYYYYSAYSAFGGSQSTPGMYTPDNTDNLRMLSEIVLKLAEEIKDKIQNRMKNRMNSISNCRCLVFVELDRQANYVPLPIHVAMYMIGCEVTYATKCTRKVRTSTAHSWSNSPRVLFMTNNMNDEKLMHEINEIASHFGITKDDIRLVHFSEVDAIQTYPIVYFAADHYSPRNNHSKYAKKIVSVRPELVFLSGCSTAIGIRKKFWELIGLLLRNPFEPLGIPFRSPILGLAEEVVRRSVHYCYASLSKVFTDGIIEVFEKTAINLRNNKTIPLALCEACKDIIKNEIEVDIKSPTLFLTAAAYICVERGH
jgi:hypothetical protein